MNYNERVFILVILGVVLLSIAVDQIGKYLKSEESPIIGPIRPDMPERPMPNVTEEQFSAELEELSGSLGFIETVLSE